MESEAEQKLEQKIDTVLIEIMDIRMAIVKLETLVEERRKEGIPDRVNKLERAQSRMVGYGAAALLFVPIIVSQGLDMLRGALQ